MRLTASRAYTRTTAVPKMPPGLVDLMEGLTKDVLKNNPTNIYEFCANHLEKLLEVRDGPSPKQSLTLEEKIFIAQEKVRQRAKGRQEQFYNKVLSDVPSKHDDPDNDDFSKKAENATQDERMSHLKAPVHHDQDLSPSSEVEISHEPYTDNSITSKDSYIDETDEIPISKSSTYSSVSKSTVIDLGNDHETNKQEIDDGIDASKIELDYTDEPVQEKETVDVPKDVITQNKSAADESLDNTEININNNNLQTVKQESTVFISDEGKATKEYDNTIDAKEDSIGVFDEPNTPVNVEGKSTVTLNSPVEVISVIVEEDETNQIEPTEKKNEDESSAKHSIEEVKIYPEGPAIKITDDTHTNGDPDKPMSTENGHNEKNNQIEVMETETENNTSSSETNVKQHVDSVDVITNGGISVENHTKVSDYEDEIDYQAQIGAHEFRGNNAEDAEEMLPTPEPVEKNNEENASEAINAKTTIKNEGFDKNNVDSNIFESPANLKTNEDETHNVINISTKDKEIVSKDDIENKDSIISVSKPEEEQIIAENNDDSSGIGSDLSKADDDVVRSDHENGQSNMDLETAAVTIQKVFRSFLFKSRNSTFEDITNDEATSLEEDNDKKEEYYTAANLNKERRPLGITRMDTVLQTVNEEKSLSLSTDDSSTLSSAATTIQAHVRGFLVRNRLNSYKTVSTNSLVNSNEMLDTDPEQQKNKTVLNIHIVPEEGNYFSRDESLLTSMDLSLDGSPPSSINLHPLSYDLVSERRKLLKREDAIQSVSPPSNNSGKLSEDSVKEVLINENGISKTDNILNEKEDQLRDHSPETMVTTVTAVAVNNTSNEQEEDTETGAERERSISTDESDVITPYIVASPRSIVGDFENSSKLLHSGEFHDVVLPTKVSRSDTTVVREFKNVLAYILLWNNS